MSDAEENKNRSKDKCMFLLYISANSVENCKASQKTAETSGEMVTEFTLKVNVKAFCNCTLQFFHA